MNESDPLLSRLRDLPSPSGDPATRARVLRAATRELRGASAVARAWSAWALPAMLLACEAAYVLDALGKMRAIFG